MARLWKRGKNLVKPFMDEAHYRSQSPLRLVDVPPREALSVPCQNCVNRYQIPEEGRGCCGL